MRVCVHVFVFVTTILRTQPFMKTELVEGRMRTSPVLQDGWEASESLQVKLSDHLNKTYCGSQQMLAVRLRPQGLQQVFCFKEPADLGTASQLTVTAALMFMQVASAHTDRQGSGN